jgi:predicted permease
MEHASNQATMTSFWQDVRFSLRLLANSPGFTIIALLTLMLGIGANSTIFSWINGTLLNPIPGVANTQELAAISLGTNPQNPFPLTYPDFEHVRRESRSLAGIAGFSMVNSMNLTGTGKPERVWGTLASANYFDVLGVKPALGRAFLPEDDLTPGGAPVAVLSYRLWQTHFGANSGIIGQTISINQHKLTVVGVAPPHFQGSQTGLRSDLWVPVMMQEELTPGGDTIHNYHFFWFFVIGRLKPGVAAPQAQQELNLIMQPMVRQYPEEHKGHETVTLTPLWRFGANAFFSTLLPLLMAISGVVLLLTCANVANLLLVRSVARRREIAIRLSMGASRWRLFQQLLIESLMLSLAGGVAALLVTLWTSGSLMLLVPPVNMPVDLTLTTDRTVLLATLLISVFTCVLFGVLPALRATAMQPAAVLKENTRSTAGGRGKSRLNSVLVVAQISLSLLLLVCAGLFIRSFASARQFNPGFNPDHVLLASYDLFSAGYSAPAGIQFNRQLQSRVAALAGVEAVTVTNRVPMDVGGGSTSVKPEGYVWQAHESMEVPEAMVGPNYLHTMQIPLAAGRDITTADNETSQPVALVNQSFADRYWPHQNALGKRIVTDISDKTFVVVGVTRNSSVTNLNADPGAFLYLPLYQLYRPEVTVAVRVAGEPFAYAAAVEKAVHESNPELPLFQVTTLRSALQLGSIPTRIAGTFVSTFGVLAAVGVYGVISYTTRQRTSELAIRLAFGAERRQVFRLVLTQGLRLALIGISIGLAFSVALTRFLKDLLFGVTSTDWVTFTSVSILLAAVSLAACFVPAWRATQVNPMAALRHE